MSKLGIWIEKRLCHFIGWDYNLLKQCGEASHRLLKIYTCAILIIMILWFVIGYVFSQRYIGVSSVWGRLLAGFAFALIVYFVERIIILHLGSRGIYAFRLVLAVCMAILGAFIFDQIIFKNDLVEAIRKDERAKLKSENNTKIQDLQKQQNKLKLQTDTLWNEYQQTPFIERTDVTTERYNDPETGETRVRSIYQRTKVPNPVAERARANESRIVTLDSTIRVLEFVDIDKAVDKRIKNKKTGFLEELKASLRVISESWISIVFYCILFVVLLCLELFVVSLKLFKSKKCEYDMIVEHQLEVKKMQLDNQMRSLKEKYVTNTMEKQ